MNSPCTSVSQYGPRKKQRAACGQFETDEAAADDHDMIARCKVTFDGQDIIEGARVIYAAQVRSKRKTFFARRPLPHDSVAQFVPMETISASPSNEYRWGATLYNGIDHEPAIDTRHRS